ncbi:hypothetical protein DFH11DRAFT_1505082 [Phellopilus nigrolimitatus]|nr:hypothetical protein DFH11DRAFT_1505082 [Phellopilus nigrolimitatus]
MYRLQFPGCKEFIDALEQCHSSFWSKYFGGCNSIKHDLNMCLRKERVDRAVRNREDAKVRAERRQKALEVLHQDDQ